jgi:hypothetical protein
MTRIDRAYRSQQTSSTASALPAQIGELEKKKEDAPVIVPPPEPTVPSQIAQAAPLAPTSPPIEVNSSSETYWVGGWRITKAPDLVTAAREITNESGSERPPRDGITYLVPAEGGHLLVSFIYVKSLGPDGAL